MSTLAFFPWLQLKNAIDVEPAHLIQYRRGREPAGLSLAAVDTVTEPYVSARNRPVRGATLLRYDDNDLLDDIADETIPELFELAALVCTSGLAARVFFAWKYWNSDNFQFTVQRFDDPARGSLIETRRLDGSQTTFIPHENLVVARPVYASADPGVELDVLLLEALIAGRDEDDWFRFKEASLQFNLANSDSFEVAIETSLVLLNGAFERVLDAEEGSERDLCERFVEAVNPSDTITIGDCQRFDAPAVRERFRRGSPVREAWIRDFFRVRGDLAHGRTGGRYPGVWTVREHLLLGGFLFPLVLKTQLAQRDLYELCDSDLNGIDAFEALCCADHFARSGMNPASFPWHDALTRAGLDRIVGRWLEENPQFFDEPEPEARETEG